MPPPNWMKSTTRSRPASPSIAPPCGQARRVMVTDSTTRSRRTSERPRPSYVEVWKKITCGPVHEEFHERAIAPNHLAYLPEPATAEVYGPGAIFRNSAEFKQI